MECGKREMGIIKSSDLKKFERSSSGMKYLVAREMSVAVVAY